MYPLAASTCMWAISVQCIEYTLACGVHSHADDYCVLYMLSFFCLQLGLREQDWHHIPHFSSMPQALSWLALWLVVWFKTAGQL